MLGMLCVRGKRSKGVACSSRCLLHDECRAARDLLTIRHFSSETRSPIASHALVLLSGTRYSFRHYVLFYYVPVTHFPPSRFFRMGYFMLLFNDFDLISCSQAVYFSTSDNVFCMYHLLYMHAMRIRHVNQWQRGQK